MSEQPKPTIGNVEFSTGHKDGQVVHGGGYSIIQDDSTIEAIAALDVLQEHPELRHKRSITESYRQSPEITAAVANAKGINRLSSHGADDAGAAPDNAHFAGSSTSTTKEGIRLSFPAYMGVAVGDEANQLADGSVLQMEPEGIQKAGLNPDKSRNFVGDEFPRMLVYSAPKFDIQEVETENGEKVSQVVGVLEPGKPAFYSYSKDGQSAPEEMNIVVATSYETMPSYMKEGSVGASFEGREEFAFNNQSFEEAFDAPSDKIIEAHRIAANDVQATTGIKVNVMTDVEFNDKVEKGEMTPDDVNITLAGFKNGNERLAGFASFPGAAEDWQELQGLGHKQGFTLVNTDYCNHEKVSLYKVYDLMSHEGGGFLGHNFGFGHPHDLGKMHMKSSESLNATVMSYTDSVFCGPHIFNEKGELTPTITKDGEIVADKRDGMMAGAVDYGVRDYCPNAPKISGIDNLVYDMEAARDYNFELHNKGQNSTLRTTKMTAFLPIDATGKNTTIKGTDRGDIIDTEPGHRSSTAIFEMEQKEDEPTQHFVVTGGHIDKVIGRAGDNKIYLSSKGDQEIDPGVGDNKIFMYADTLDGKKTIDCHGKSDTLVLHQDLFINNREMDVKRSGDDMIIGDGENGIVVKGQFSEKDKGVSTIEVCSEQGKKNTYNIGNITSVVDIRKEVMNTEHNRADRDVKEIAKKEAEAEAGKQDSGKDDILKAEKHGDHTFCGRVGGKKGGAGMSWQATVQQEQKEQNTQKGRA